MKVHWLRARLKYGGYVVWYVVCRKKLNVEYDLDNSKVTCKKCLAIIKKQLGKDATIEKG